MLDRAVIGIALAGLATVIGLGTGSAAFAAAAEGDVRGDGVPGAINDRYIVVLKDRSADAARVRALASSLAALHDGEVGHVFSRSVRGFSLRVTEAQANRLAARSEVAYVEQDRTLTKADVQTDPPSWGLDRIDQTALPLSHSYTYPATASGVRVYVLDTGISIGHPQFEGRASHGYDFVDNDTVADDCDGHGTHVAGTIGSRAYGVAKAARLVAVRVLDCDGFGTLERVIAGVDWVTANAVKPAVANMSLGGPASSALRDAVATSIASGVTYAVSAGNAGNVYDRGADACTVSPADVPQAITVGATDKTDYRARYSNYGTCLDIFAPGDQIASTHLGNGYRTLGGTSMASAHVAGAAALLLGTTPTMTTGQVRDSIVNDAVTGTVHNAGAGSPNSLLHVGGPPAPAPLGLRAHANGRHVTAENAGQSPLVANRIRIGVWETFDQVDAGDGFIALRAHANGKFVTAENAGNSALIANRIAIGQWEKFQAINNPDGSISLRANANGKFVTAENAGASPLIANRTVIGQWEKFDRTAPLPVIHLYAIDVGRYVTAENAGQWPLIANRTQIGVWEAFDQVDAGDGFIALRAHANDMFVTAESAGGAPLIANRTAIGQWERFEVFHTGTTIGLRATYANGGFVTASSSNTPLIADADVLDWGTLFDRDID